MGRISLDGLGDDERRVAGAMHDHVTAAYVICWAVAEAAAIIGLVRTFLTFDFNGLLPYR